jgi:mannosyltransferase OCH1-like enzyme
MAKTRKVRHLEKPVIPKVIHQIWVGENVMPHEWMDTVVKFAKEYGYEYKLWTEKNIDTLPWHSFKGLRKAYTTMKSKNAISGLGDIIRKLTLYEYGGICMDADTVIMKPKNFNTFLESNKANVFFAWEETATHGFSRLVAAGLIGSIKAHPFIKILLDGIPLSVKRGIKQKAWITVGPLYITRKYTSYKNDFPDIKIYPMKYFYPIRWHGITDPKLHTKVKIPKESMLFQYGYSTNNFKMYFNNCTTRKIKKD